MAARADGVLFLKNGYSLWMHAVPFGVAALLLLTVSLPADDPLHRLAALLSRPGPLWVPALLLTAVSAAVYLLTLRYQVRRAYLWPERVARRTAATALVFLVVAFGATYLVWRLAAEGTGGAGGAWACLILALLSLAGLGWTLPRGWVDEIGVRSPDYGRARALAAELVRVLGDVRARQTGRRQDVKRVEELLGAVRDEVEANLEREPEWASTRPRAFSAALHTLLLQMETAFEKDADVVDFAAAWRDEKAAKYPAFTGAMAAVVRQWPAWKYVKPSNP